MPNNVNNPRRDFIKKVSIAAVTIGAFSFLNFRKTKTKPDYQVSSLSKEEADEIIKNEQFHRDTRVKPAPPPVPGEKAWIG